MATFRHNAQGKEQPLTQLYNFSNMHIHFHISVLKYKCISNSASQRAFTIPVSFAREWTQDSGCIFKTRNPLAWLNCVHGYRRRNFPVCTKSFPLLKQSVTLSTPCSYAANSPALTWTCTLSASGQSCSKSMALLLASTLIHWCTAIKCWWPLIALSKLPSYSLSSTCQLPALKWML